MKSTPGLNFINVLLTAFMHAEPKSAKWYWWLNCIFYAFGIYECKNARRMLMKLTPDWPDPWILDILKGSSLILPDSCLQPLQHIREVPTRWRWSGMYLKSNNFFKEHYHRFESVILPFCISFLASTNQIMKSGYHRSKCFKPCCLKVSISG